MCLKIVGTPCVNKRSEVPVGLESWATDLFMQKPVLYVSRMGMYDATPGPDTTNGFSNTTHFVSKWTAWQIGRNKLWVRQGFFIGGEHKHGLHMFAYLFSFRDMYFASMAPTLAAQLHRQWKGEEAMVLLIWARAFVTLFRDVNRQKNRKCLQRVWCQTTCCK